MTWKLTVTLLALGFTAQAADYTVYAYCDEQPTVGKAPTKRLSVSVKRSSTSVEVTSVAVKGGNAVKEERGALPDEYRAFFDGKLCPGSVDVTVTLREVRTKKTRTETTRVQVQQVD
jgi:hypothetical protein